MLKKYFLQLRAYFALSRDRHRRFSISYQRAHDFGILCNIDNTTTYEALKKLISLLQQDGKEVTVLALVENEEFASKLTIPFDFFTSEGLSSLNVENLPHVKKFIHTSFDYLYCIDKKSSPLIYYLLAKSKAQCRIGEYKSENQPFFEMMVPYSSSMLDFVNVLYKYTTKIR